MEGGEKGQCEGKNARLALVEPRLGPARLLARLPASKLTSPPLPHSNAIELQAEVDDKYLAVKDAVLQVRRARQHRVRAQHHLLPPTPELYAFAKLE